MQPTNCIKKKSTTIHQHSAEWKNFQKPNTIKSRSKKKNHWKSNCLHSFVYCPNENAAGAVFKQPNIEKRKQKLLPRNLFVQTADCLSKSSSSSNKKQSTHTYHTHKSMCTSERKSGKECENSLKNVICETMKTQKRKDNCDSVMRRSLRILECRRIRKKQTTLKCKKGYFADGSGHHRAINTHANNIARKETIDKVAFANKKFWCEL